MNGMKPDCGKNGGVLENCTHLYFPMEIPLQAFKKTIPRISPRSTLKGKAPFSLHVSPLYSRMTLDNTTHNPYFIFEIAFHDETGEYKSIQEFLYPNMRPNLFISAPLSFSVVWPHRHQVLLEDNDKMPLNDGVAQKLSGIEKAYAYSLNGPIKIDLFIE